MYVQLDDCRSVNKLGLSGWCIDMVHQEPNVWVPSEIKKNLNCYISIVENNAQKFEDWKFSVEKKLYEYLFIYLDF